MNLQQKARFSCQIIGKTLPPSIIEEKEFTPGNTEFTSAENTVKTTFRSMESKGIHLPKELFEIIACCYKQTPIDEKAAFDEKAAAALNILGTGELWLPTEVWKFEGLFPICINFGDLDYSTSDECFIEITWKYTSKEKHEPVVSMGIGG